MNHTKTYLLVRGTVRTVLFCGFALGLMMLIGFIEGMSF